MIMEDKDFTRINLEQLSKPPTKSGTYRVLVDHYWMVDINGMGLVYKKHSLQCNAIQGICTQILRATNHPAVYEKFYPIIYMLQD